MVVITKRTIAWTQMISLIYIMKTANPKISIKAHLLDEI
jgi:hypothetical protein